MVSFVIRSLLFFIIIFFLFGCEQKKPPLINLNEKLKFNESEYLLTFKDRFNDQNFSALSKDTSFQYQDTLKYFYSIRNFEPLFIKSFEQKDFVDSLLILLRNAEEHGLNPEQYHISLIANDFFNAINDTINNPARLTQMANTELYISDAILKYAYHMRYGVVNPTKIFLNSYYLPMVDSTKRNLFEPLRQVNIIQYLKDKEPKSEKYKRLQAALKKFNSYKDIKIKIISSPDKKIEPGDKNSLLILIAERLITYGYLDTSKIKVKDYTVYDSLLLEPVKRFQRLHGLNDDGVIGKSTIEKLNTTPEEYIRKIKINLERFRWNDFSDTSNYIEVNIPDFMLHCIDGNKELFKTKVCTGQRRPFNFENQFKVYQRTKRLKDKPDDWETPCLHAKISLIVLNPTWSVPPSIIREEIFAGIKKDSNYLVNRNFKVYKKGIEISPNEVNTDELTLDNIPYRIVQDPGDGNALGKMKFIFQNPFGVYLHDTPKKTAFKNSNRAVSHGCIRVEKPLQLAEYFLTDHSKWNIDYLKIEIGQKVNDKTKVVEFQKKRAELRKNASFGETTEITLEKKIPLFVDYYTAWVDENGDVNFRDDVYRQDKILMKNLFPKELSK